MDLFVNFVGAIVFSVIGFFYVRSRGKSRFAKRFIPVVSDTVPSHPTDKEQDSDVSEPSPRE